jgi:hypothetical protein
MRHHHRRSEPLRSPNGVPRTARFPGPSARRRRQPRLFGPRRIGACAGSPHTQARRAGGGPTNPSPFSGLSRVRTCARARRATLASQRRARIRVPTHKPGVRGEALRTLLLLTVSRACVRVRAREDGRRARIRRIPHPGPALKPGLRGRPYQPFSFNCLSRVRTCARARRVTSARVL